MELFVSRRPIFIQNKNLEIVIGNHQNRYKELLSFNNISVQLLAQQKLFLL